MTNCLSSSSFANLLFVNVQIGDVRATALFDTGAGMTAIAQSLLRRVRAAPEKEVLRSGNNNGVVRALQTAVIPNIRLGNVCMESCKVLVTDDADFALSDENGRIFPAEMLLGWDVISRYRWSYSAKDKSLSVSLPEKTAEHLRSNKALSCFQSMPGSALRPEWIPDIPAPSSVPLGIPGSLTSHITKQKLPVSALRNISGFPMCGCCSFGFKTRRFICGMSIFATSCTDNRRRSRRC